MWSSEKHLCKFPQLFYEPKSSAKKIKTLKTKHKINKIMYVCVHIYIQMYNLYIYITLQYIYTFSWDPN